MKKRHAEGFLSHLFRSVICTVLALPLIASAQTPLQIKIREIASGAHGTVSVACSLPGTKLSCDSNPNFHAPMQSAFKFPLGVAVLHAVESGKLNLDQQVRFLPSDSYPGTFSPLQDMYPKAGVDVPLRKLLELSVGQSDNTASDILMRLLGGPEPVQQYIDTLHLGGMKIVDSERSMHNDEQRQYRNYAEPVAFVRLLRLLADGKLLNQDHTAYLLSIMTKTKSFPNRMRGLLPEGTVVAHKTGTSGYDDKGMAAATNDVGLITLPDGQQLALAVLVTDAHADEAAVAETIAKIAEACYDAARSSGR